MRVKRFGSIELLLAVGVGYLLSTLFYEPRVHKNAKSIDSIISMDSTYQAHGRKSITNLLKNQDSIIKLLNKK